jgi:hypothetical protein
VADGADGVLLRVGVREGVVEGPTGVLVLVEVLVAVRVGPLTVLVRVGARVAVALAPAGVLVGPEIGSHRARVYGGSQPGSDWWAWRHW